jgi:hypothetical protein
MNITIDLIHKKTTTKPTIVGEYSYLIVDFSRDFANVVTLRMMGG